jgi:hypothetical protein
MALGITIGRADGGVDTITPVGTTLSGAPVLTGSVNVLTASAGQVACVLPANPGAPITVLNTAASAVSLTVFPPTAAGKINNDSAGAAVSIAQNKTATFYPLANGVDFAAVVSA